MHGISSWLLLLRLFHRWPYSVAAGLSTPFGSATCVLLESSVTSSRHTDRCTPGVVVKFSVFRSHKNKMTLLLLHTHVLLVSCPVHIIGQKVKVWIEHSSSGVLTSCTLSCWARFSFSVIVNVVSGFILRAGTGRCSFVNWSKQYWPMDRVNWMLILTGEVVLVLEAACLKTFHLRFVVLPVFVRVHGLNASVPLANHAASSHELNNVSFPFAFVDFSFPCGELERSLMRPCGSIAADSSSVCRYMYRCSFSRSGALSSSIATRVFIRYCGRLLDDHWLYWWYWWRLCHWYRWRVWRMHTIARSGPLPLSPILW